MSAISELKTTLQNQLNAELSKLQGLSNTTTIQEFGTAVRVMDGIVIAYGLDEVMASELVEFEHGASGMVLNLEEDSVSIVLMNNESSVMEGEKVYRKKAPVTVPTGNALLGRVVDALGHVIDGKGELKDVKYMPIEAKAPGIIDRQSVREPLQTGILAVDNLIPIGRGQRELIIGDRQSGKTTIALDTIINQAKINDTLKNEKDKVYCVYVAIGQKNSSVAKLMKLLEEKDALKYTIIVAATAAEPAAKQFLAPYTGCTMGEYFRNNGMHALIVYDDLSKHAVAYRQISLLLRRPPGREAYPGDVFYLHSRLLERAAKLSEARGSGSLTALPIVETQVGDVSAYIPTNIISITDGQIFLETELFHKGIKPAINVGLSVSRVGSSAQTKAIKQVAGSIKLQLAQFREMESFMQFSSDIDPISLKLLKKGQALTEILKQNKQETYTLAEQVLLLFAGSHDYISDIPLKLVERFKHSLISHVKTQNPAIMARISDEKQLSPETIDILHKSIGAYVELFKKTETN